jgi:hypothetical protein
VLPQWAIGHSLVHPCLVLSLYFDRLLGLIACRALMHG